MLPTCLFFNKHHACQHVQFTLVTRRPYCPGRPKRALFYHAKPRNGNHGDEAKTKLFWSPGAIWAPCDKGEYGNQIT